MVPIFELLFDCNNKLLKLKKEDTNWVPTVWADYIDPDATTMLLGDAICNIEEEEYWEACQHALKSPYEARMSDEDEERGKAPGDSDESRNSKSDCSSDNDSNDDGNGEDDSNSDSALLSFMDGFLGYNQIKMALEDMEKTSFITPWGMCCYKVMPFGLKNASATYQRVATTLLHDLIHKEVQVYVDDMILKSKDREGHISALRKFFERIQFNKLQLNLKKCIFGVTSRKLLEFMVSQRGIEVDPGKIKEIVKMKRRSEDF